MQKRARILDNKNIRKLQITRRGRSDINQSSSATFICVKMIFAWIAMVALDTLTGFRFELLWPTWLMARAAFDSISMRNQHCVTTIANPTAARFSVLFVCVTATSDLICYLFIPIRMLIFLATTYVWLNLYCNTQGGFIRTIATLYGGDRSQSWSILVMSFSIVAFELFLRIRLTKFDYALFLKNNPVLYGVLPAISVTDWAGVPPVWPRSLNAFFGAHSIGYPAVLVTVSLHYYFNEWKLRRKQNDVANRNEQLFRILVESLPAEYEGPKDYTTSSQCIEEGGDLYYFDPPVAMQPMQAITGPPSATPPTSSKKNGSVHKKSDSTSKKKKNGSTLINNSTPPNDKKKREKLRNDEEIDDSDGDDYWRDSSDGERRGGGIWIIRFICDAASWAFCTFFTSSTTSSPSTSSANSHNPPRRSAVTASAHDEYEEDEISTIGEDVPFEKKNGRTDSLTSTTKSRSGTMTSQSSQRPQQNNNNQKHKANGKNHHHHHAKTNGHARVTTTVRDSSHDTNASKDDTEVRNLQREIEQLRSDLASRRTLEEDFKLQVSHHELNESRLSQQLTSMKSKVEQMEMKWSAMERHRESDKAQLEAAERKYAELMNKKTEIEATLSAERKARNESDVKKYDVAEHQRERERQLESEMDKLRAEVKSKEETNMKLEGELHVLRNYKEENDIEALNMEIHCLTEKLEHLEDSLAGENQLKQSLFKCLGESRIVLQLKDDKIADLKAQVKKAGGIVTEPILNGHSAEVNNENDTTASDQSSPHQHSAMGSPVPSGKMPLSVNVNNRDGSPFNDKISPIGVQLAGISAQIPHDFIMPIGSPVVGMSSRNTIRYNEFNHMPTGGEHRLFDTPAIISAPSPTGSNPDEDFHLSLNKGKFGAPSNPATRPT